MLSNTAFVTGLFFSLALSADSHAGQALSRFDIELIRDRASLDYQGFEYETNPELGRARLKLEFRDLQAGAEESGLTYAPVLIDGLSFDSASERILFSRDGYSVVCAQMVAKKRLGIPYKKLVETGNCKVENQVVRTLKDDGFRVTPIKQTVVTFRVF